MILKVIAGLWSKERRLVNNITSSMDSRSLCFEYVTSTSSAQPHQSHLADFLALLTFLNREMAALRNMPVTEKLSQGGCTFRGLLVRDIRGIHIVLQSPLAPWISSRKWLCKLFIQNFDYRTIFLRKFQDLKFH
jgi:hypothetical protein